VPARIDTILVWVNKSDHVIDVSYRFKDYVPVEVDRFIEGHTPAKLLLVEFQKTEYHWEKLSKDQYQFDKYTGTFTVPLAPEEVLFLQSASNYRGDESQFHLASIKITGAQGSIDLQGAQAQKQFQLESDTKLVIRYK
jgi:hypothetical protein